MAQETRVNTVDAKNRLNELLTEVERTKRPLVVVRRGKPIAVVIDYESYEESGKIEGPHTKSALSKELLSFHERLKKKYPEGTGDSVEILRQMRADRGGA
ncbi:MAG TPA: type II toxin-antitoxin system Phd/YefM family antitoxin [bacterium]|nr:type II toxin-antitoxin system Phd/YefM family antitoxin [bacterium]